MGYRSKCYLVQGLLQSYTTTPASSRHGGVAILWKVDFGGVVGWKRECECSIMDAVRAGICVYFFYGQRGGGYVMDS